MTIEEAISAVTNGKLIECTAMEYHDGIRTAVQMQANKWIDQNQIMRAMIALEEIRRLDKIYL